MAQFLSNLPNGALVKFGSHSVGSEAAQKITWMIVDKNHKGYPSDSVTLITEKIIDLRAYDAAENEDDTLQGNNNYKLSNINQWLNSEASAGQWYTASHSDDTPPNKDKTHNRTPYESQPGFLYNFTVAERLALLPTTIVNQVHKDISESFTTKVFLPSWVEITGTHNYPDGSVRFALFASGDASCGLTSQAFNYTTSDSKPTNLSTKWYYYTRSTEDNDVNIARPTLPYSTTYPYDGDVGIRPVINLTSKTKVSDTTDSDGCYTVLQNNLPTISGTNTDLGLQDDEFSLTYTISDADNETVTVTEYIDNVMVRSYVAVLNTENNFEVKGLTWLKLINGIHTLKIVATDGFDTSTRVFTFTKSVNELVVQRTTPIRAATRPSRIIVTLAKNIPYDAILTVEVCNNGFDAIPTWENIGTSSISSGLPFSFTNMNKESGKDWGVNIRVTVNRNGGEGACYITEIGGNFE